MKKYKICSIIIEKTELKKVLEESYWNEFQYQGNRKSSLTIFFLQQRNMIYGLEKLDIRKEIFSLIRSDADCMLVGRDWREVYILPLKDQTKKQAFLIQAFYSHAVKHKMIQMHSSLVSYQDQGIMFLGPSGIGKTTQAELWNHYRDARIINGDIVFVQETSDEFLGWGTPWHGSSSYCENTSVPVAAMVVLKQAKENSIRELTGFEKVTEVSNSVFYPQWLEGGMELCLETLDHLLKKVPVYELSCRPDEDAVRLTEQVVFHAK